MALAGRGRKPMSEINVVPYIDVMLVLLIIFMVTAPLLTQGIKVDLPDADAPAIDPAELQNRPPLVLSVDRQGRLYLNQGERPEEPLEDSMIEARVAAVLRNAPGLPVFVKGDRDVPYGRVVEAMVLLQGAGAQKVGFLTDPVNIRGAR
ncbi:MAG: protein TolR [Gammaproteobacteria bacterium]|jgi:biopolymer transport protein TolR|nr:protein TolR [Gammaproteobacteria bacterium]MBM4209265.1 protein TolR [Gammaproteobacteria bacterium]MBM4231297.1 protein TolR [Gammaproteobacteria bacterium]